MAECWREGCRAEAIVDDGLCLIHVPDGSRLAFLQGVADRQHSFRRALRRLTIDRNLLDELRSVIDGLEEDIDFSDAVFTEDVDFGKVTFARRARFNGARFDGAVSFIRATFDHNARFNGVTFEGDAIFGGTREYVLGEWLGDRQEAATFHGLAEFVGARFRGAVRFDWVRFDNDVTFANAQFDSELRHEEPPDPVATNREIRLANTRFRAGIDADLPAGSVLAAGMDLGAASRLKVRGPIRLDHVTLTHPLTILTTNREEVAQLRERGSAPELRDLTGTTLQAPLIVGEGISLAHCEMGGAVGLDHLTLHAGTSPLVKHRGRRVLYDEITWRRNDVRRGHRLAEAVLARLGRPTWASLRASDEPLHRLSPGPIASRYRQLRQGLEEAKNAPGSADFYYGEMEMRRAATPSPYERFFLWLYWSVSGYGLRASRAIAAYVAVLAAATAAFRYGPDSLHAACPSGQTCADLDDWWSILVFLVRWSVSVFPAPETLGLSTGGQAILLVLRFLSPILLALTFLAVRARVHR